jgi:hypothetical protein
MPRPDLGFGFAPAAPPASPAPWPPAPPPPPPSRPPGVPPAAPPSTGLRDARRRPRRIPLPRARARPRLIAEVSVAPRLAVDLDDFQELRHGLFGDDGRTLPPSWWAR